MNIEHNVNICTNYYTKYDNNTTHNKYIVLLNNPIRKKNVFQKGIVLKNWKRSE